MAEELMQYVNRSEAPQNNQEILTSYEWLLTFKHKPNIVFMPQDSLFEIRLTNVDLNYSEQVSVQKSQVRGGFDVIQPGLIVTSGSCTLHFQDFEDQAIAAMIQDWCEKENNRKTHRSAHKRDLYADIILYRLNSFRKKVYQIEAQTCLPSNGTYGDTYESTKNLLGKMGLTLDFEWAQKTLLNLV